MRALMALAIALAPALARACAVCGAGDDDPAQGAYLTMTLIISGLPLLMLGGLIGYVVVKSRTAGRTPAPSVGEAPRTP
jgi:hypothetical protein